jgi:hypothetical protein
MAQEKKDDISINLNCYLIRFRKKNQKDIYLKVKEAFLAKTFPQIRQSLVNYFDSNNTYKNLPGDRILYLDKTLSIKNTYYSGILKKGYSGQESYIETVKGKKASTITTVLTDQFNSSPFYFLLAQPDQESKYLIFLSQSYKQYGFKDLFEEAFKEFYKQEVLENFICEFSTLSIGSLFNKYIAEGNIRKLRFKKHGLSKNAENILSDEENKEQGNYDMELSITAKKAGFMGIKNNITAKNSSFIETIKLDDFDYDQVFADVSYGGRKRVLNITRPEEFSASFDLTEKSEINPKTKHPNFEKLDKEAYSLLIEEIIPNVDL